MKSENWIKSMDHGHYFEGTISKPTIKDEELMEFRVVLVFGKIGHF